MRKFHSRFLRIRIIENQWIAQPVCDHLLWFINYKICPIHNLRPVYLFTYDQGIDKLVVSSTEAVGFYEQINSAQGAVTLDSKDSFRAQPNTLSAKELDKYVLFNRNTSSPTKKNIWKYIFHFPFFCGVYSNYVQ